MRSPKRFTTRALLMVVSFICIVLAWRKSVERERLNQLTMVGDRVIDSAMIQAHWELDDDSPQTGKVVFLLTNGEYAKGQPADQFEAQLLEQWSRPSKTNDKLKPESAVRQATGTQSDNYYRAVRLRNSCTNCHNGRQGELFSIAKVVFPQ